MNKKLITSLIALASIGVAIGLPSSASAVLTCFVPSNFAFVVPISPGIRSACSETISGLVVSATLNGVANTSVSANLTSGRDASVQGFNASRLPISTCFIQDLTTGGGAVTDNTGCNGAVFISAVMGDQ